MTRETGEAGTRETWSHAALIERPASPNGWAVMLFGGGLSADLHWTTPGSYTHDGETTRLTISGDDVRDADVLAEALLDAGFVVLRYSSIREGDPLRAASPVRAQARPFPETVRMATAAFEALCARSGIERSRVFALGHSLGAARAVLATGGNAPGYVLLAPAYATPVRTSPGALARASSHPGRDFDASGDIAAWERAAAERIDAGLPREAERFESGGAAFEWTSDALARTGAPALVAWGGRDATSLHGPLLDALLDEQAGAQLETHYFASLGHTLGPVAAPGSVLQPDADVSASPELVGPIDDRVVRVAVEWLKERTSQGTEPRR